MIQQSILSMNQQRGTRSELGSMALMRVQPLEVRAAHEPSKGRQVLECGDGVREVTALALVAIEARELAAGTATAPESGDSEDSVTAVQDARARTEAHSEVQTSLNSRFLQENRRRFNSGKVSGGEPPAR